MSADTLSFDFDLVIVGGGIAGLWTLAEARAQGLNAILFEKNALGAGQTIASQGIIHGGSKYALSAKMTKAGNIIGQMPKRWKQATENKKSVYLPDVSTLAEAQYMVPTNNTDTKLLSFLGSKTMASRTKTIQQKNLPQPLVDAGISTNVYQLNETVVDVGSVLQSFYNQYAEYIFQAEITMDAIQSVGNHNYEIETAAGTVSCSHILFAAGEGFEHVGLTAPEMQKRPLQMVMVKGDLPYIFAHFVGRSNKPLLTITSHRHDNQIVWYMGGGLAEDGVEQPKVEIIDSAKSLINKMMPEIDCKALKFDTLHISRAEPKQHGLVRPDDAFIQINRNLMVGWPTKLALAPRFADKVINEVFATSLQVAGSDQPLPDFLYQLEKPTIAHYPWHNL